MPSREKRDALKKSQFETPLGPMIAIADEKTLYLLEFIDRRGIEPEIDRLRSHTNTEIIEGMTNPLASIKHEIEAYFKGTLKKFKTPTSVFGTPFQKMTWNALTLIPYGETRSYGEIANSIKKPTAYRAVANANGKNQLAILIPCHRVINSNGDLGGYAANVSRKDWLLQHEKKFQLLQYIS